MFPADPMDGVHVDRDGRVIRYGRRVGWVDHYRAGHRWRWVLEGGEESPVLFGTRREAVEMLVRRDDVLTRRTP